MTLEEMQTIVGEVTFADYEFRVLESTHGFIYLQANYLEPDTETGRVGLQFTRRWPLSPDMNKSEVVSTAFKCALTSMEHKTREWFLYRGRAVYHPHYDVDALYAICDQREMR